MGEVSKQIIEVLNYLGEKFGIAIDWSSETILPYIKELGGRYISYEIMTSIVWMSIGTLFLVAAIICFVKFLKSHIAHGYDMDEFSDYTIGVIISAGVFIICLLIIGTQIFDIVKCTYLPELQIYEYINELISTPSN